MKYVGFLIIFIVVIVSSVFTSSSVLAGDAFSDLFSQTKICFSHIAITKGWETEVAVINPTAKRVSGNFTFYDMDGNQLGEPVSKTLEANGRYQMMVGATFAQRGEVEYMIFSASVYGLKGYSKFSHEDYGRASIMASAPQKSGLFTKIDHEGWTGIAFVNTSSEVAYITLKAYSDAGGEPIAIELMTVEPGEKVVEPARNIFTKSQVAAATYISFESDQGIVGFFLNGYGNKLDGSKAL